MAAALELVLKTPLGRQALGQLAAGKRESVEVEINQLFPIEAVIDRIGPVTFNDRDLKAARILKTPCVAVLEGRLRASELHLHVHTFYPKLTPPQIQQLFDAKTSP